MFRASFAALALFICSLAQANEVTIEKVSGPVSVSGAGVTVGQKIREGASVVTGQGGSAVLRFADGQVVSLLDNTTLKINAYRYEEKAPSSDSTVLELAKGAARFLTGLLGKRNPGAFKLDTPTATIGIRGTDFIVVHQNPSFVNVVSGGVSVSNSAGAVSLAAGQAATVSAGVAPAAASVGAFPASVQGAMSSLGGQTLASGATAGAGSASGGSAAGSTAAASGTAVGGITAGTVAVGVAAAAALGVIVSGGENGSSSSTTTSTATQTK